MPFVNERNVLEPKMKSIRVPFHQIALATLLLPAPVFAATADYQAQITLSAPILWYQFNEASGNAVNYGSLGASYDAAYLGAPTRQAARREEIPA
jgi:hypothetical protein